MDSQRDEIISRLTLRVHHLEKERDALAKHVMSVEFRDVQERLTEAEARLELCRDNCKAYEQQLATLGDLIGKETADHMRACDAWGGERDQLKQQLAEAKARSVDDWSDVIGRNQWQANIIVDLRDALGNPVGDGDERKLRESLPGMVREMKQQLTAERQAHELLLRAERQAHEETRAKLAEAEKRAKDCEDADERNAFAVAKATASLREQLAETEQQLTAERQAHEETRGRLDNLEQERDDLQLACLRRSNVIDVVLDHLGIRGVFDLKALPDLLRSRLQSTTEAAKGQEAPRFQVTREEWETFGDGDDVPSLSRLNAILAKRPPSADAERAESKEAVSDHEDESSVERGVNAHDEDHRKVAAMWRAFERIRDSGSTWWAIIRDAVDEVRDGEG